MLNASKASFKNQVRVSLLTPPSSGGIHIVKKSIMYSSTLKINIKRILDNSPLREELEKGWG